MGARTKIEWVQGPDGVRGATWNPITGCTKVSPGCDHCYAEAVVEYHEQMQGLGTGHFPFHDDGVGSAP